MSATRKIIGSILDGSLDKAEYETLPVFNLSIPKKIENIDKNLLNPSITWESEEKYFEKARDLAGQFIKNIREVVKEPEKVEPYGPTLD